MIHDVWKNAQRCVAYLDDLGLQILADTSLSDLGSAQHFLGDLE
jgi:hypothetical protein